jgi:hypothetical protein
MQCVVDASAYTGTQTNVHNPEVRNAGHVASALTETLPVKGHGLFTDNWYIRR